MCRCELLSFQWLAGKGFGFDGATGSAGVGEGCVAGIGRSSVGGETAQVNGDSKMTATEPSVGSF